MDLLIPHFRFSNPLEHVFVTQGFGENATPFYAEMGLDGHTGQDLRAITGTPCFAVIDAVCINSGQDYTGGRFVRLQTDSVTIGGKEYRLQVLYYHLQEWSVLAGERVYRGQQVGLTGNTGRLTTAPHLHLEVVVQWFEGGIWKSDINNGYRGAIDPKPLFTYKPMAENPYGIPANTFIQLTEGVGGFALWTGEHFIVDDTAKLLASWEVRNKGNTNGKTLALSQVAWDAYKKVNLKLQPV